MSGDKDKIIRCFAPLKGKSPKVLILGTMPGGAALMKKEYYGYEHNAFWKIMFDIFEASFTTDYEIRKNLLKNNGIALWDTIASCEREGSSDTAIKNIVYNNIEGFLKDNKSVKAIFLNSKFAYKAFTRAVKNDIERQIFVMPSTSPANTVKYEKKLEQWAKVKEFVNKSN
ncbi:MAG: DNA-deoxyinosine glycosylase [Endomicrobium sp.]|jgi:hypoxanthine-DNA glycosylase|nr:DNA-deoxyinosine glycosylase [Endomicrobium sp.]